MARKAIFLAWQIQHRFILPAVNAMAHTAVVGPDRPMDIFAFDNVFMANQTELAAFLQNEFRQPALMRAVATGTAFFECRMRELHAISRILVTLQTEARFIFDERHGTFTRVLLIRAFVTRLAIPFGNRRMHMLGTAENRMAISRHAAFGHR